MMFFCCGIYERTLLAYYVCHVSDQSLIMRKKKLCNKRGFRLLQVFSVRVDNGFLGYILDLYGPCKYSKGCLRRSYTHYVLSTIEACYPPCYHLVTTSLNMVNIASMLQGLRDEIMQS